MTEVEPRIWSHITDALPDSHPSAFRTLYCAECGKMVHAGNNECMTTWVETGRGAFCIRCFPTAIESTGAGGVTYHLMDEGEGWGLPA